MDRYSIHWFPPLIVRGTLTEIPRFLVAKFVMLFSRTYKLLAFSEGGMPRRLSCALLIIAYPVSEAGFPTAAGLAVSTRIVPSSASATIWADS